MLITTAATGGCPPAHPGQHGSRSFFDMNPFRLPCFVLKNLFFVACVPSVLCFPLRCGGAHVWLWLAFFVGFSSANSGPTSEEAGCKVLGKTGKSSFTVLFIFAK